MGGAARSRRGAAGDRGAADAAFLAALVASSDDAIIGKTIDGTIISWNAAAARLYGYAAAEAVGRPIALIVPPDRWDELTGILAHLARGEHIEHFETVRVRKDGQHMAVSLSISPVRDAADRIVGAATIARAVTERERLLTAERQAHADAEAARARLELLAEAGGALATALDLAETLAAVARLAVAGWADYCFVDLLSPDGAIKRATVAHADPALADTAAGLRDYPSDPANPHSVVGRVVRSGRAEHVTLAPEHWVERIAQDAEHARILGALRPTTCLAAPLAARGQVLGALVIYRAEPRPTFDPDDVALAEELGRRAGLAIDNARLFAAERAARAEAETAVRARDEFLSIAAHELRTPLTSIKALGQLIARRLVRPEIDRVQLARLLDRHDGQVQRFETLVEDLLDVSRLRLGQLELRPEPTDLAAVARDVLERFEHAAERVAGHVLALDASAPVVGDWDAAQLDQVLANLVSNALKYSPTGGEVRVRVRPAGKWAKVAVSDQGVGIRPEEQLALFRPFARGAAGQEAGGLGLGLYLAAQIVERHGGTIMVESAPGVGSIFSVRLPRNDARGCDRGSSA